MNKKKKFIEVLTLDPEYNYNKAFKKVYGYYCPKKLGKLLDDPYVVKRLERKQKYLKYKMNITEEMIIERLWKEATEGDKSASRIQALVHLGKHIGMFKDKPDNNKSDTITYQIINYGNIDTKKLEENTDTNKLEEEKVELLEDKETLEIEIETTNYSSE